MKHPVTPTNWILTPVLEQYVVFSYTELMRITDDLQNQMEKMRKLGLSVPEISNKLGIPKSTVLRHIKHVQIAPKNLQRWLDRKRSSQISAEKNWQIAGEKAKERISQFSQNDLAYIGAAIYWAEGSKKDFSLSNTDPKIIKIFIESLLSCYQVTTSDIKISIRIYEDLDKNECLKFWSKVTGIKLTNKTSFNVLKGAKKGKLKYGMCRVRVKKGGNKLKELLSLKEKIHALVVQRIEQGTPKP